MPKVVFVNEHRIVDVPAGKSQDPGPRARHQPAPRTLPGRELRILRSLRNVPGLGARIRRGQHQREEPPREMAGMRGERRLSCQVKILGDVEVTTMAGGDNRLRAPRPIAAPPQPTIDPYGEAQSRSTPLPPPSSSLDIRGSRHRHTRADQTDGDARRRNDRRRRSGRGRRVRQGRKAERGSRGRHGGRRHHRRWPDGLRPARSLLPRRARALLCSSEVFREPKLRARPPESWARKPKPTELAPSSISRERASPFIPRGRKSCERPPESMSASARAACFTSRIATPLARSPSCRSRVAKAGGLALEYLDAAGVYREEPSVTAKATSAIHFENDGRIDPPIFSRPCTSQRRRPERASGRASTCERSTSRNGGARGVILEDGTRIAAGRVVLAAGSWSTLVAGVPLASTATFAPRAARSSS